MHAERCPRVGRDPTLPRSVLGFHVVDFPFFLPNGETRRPRLERAVRVLAHQRGVLVQSSRASDLATALGRRPRPLGVRVTPPHPLLLAPNGRGYRSLFIPPETWPSCWRAAPRASREHDEPLGSRPTLDPAPSPVLGSALGHADYVLTHHRVHGRRTRPCAHYPRAPTSACQGSHTPVIDRRGAGSRGRRKP